MQPHDRRSHSLQGIQAATRHVGGPVTGPLVLLSPPLSLSWGGKWVGVLTGRGPSLPWSLGPAPCEGLRFLAPGGKRDVALQGLQGMGTAEGRARGSGLSPDPP